MDRARTRVRRRKAQRRPKTLKGRVIGWTFNLILMAIVVAGFVGYRSLRGFLRSEELVEEIEREISRESGMRAEVEPMRWSGWTGGSKSVVVESSAKTRRLEIKGLEVEVDPWSAFDSVMELPAGKVDRVWLEVDLTKSAGPPVKVPPKKDSFFSKYAPEEGRFGELAFGHIGGRVVIPFGEITLEGLRGEVRGPNADGMLDFAFRQGVLMTPVPSWERIQIEAAEGFASKDGAVEIRDALVRVDNGVEVRLRGKMDRESQKWQAEVEMSRLKMSRLVPGAGSDVIEGEAVVTGTLSGQGSQAKGKGRLRWKNGRIAASLITKLLRDYLKDDTWLDLPVEEATFAWLATEEGLTARTVVVRTEGIFVLRGEVSVSRALKLSGKIELGVTPVRLLKVPLAERTVFSRQSGGLYWAAFEVQGWAFKPTETLSKQLRRALKMEDESKEGGGVTPLDRLRGLLR